MDLTSSFTMDVVGKALDGLSMRHKAIASNLANVDTPNYHRRGVSFESDLRQAVQDHHKAKSTQADNDRPLPLATGNPLHYSPNPLHMTLEKVNPVIEENWESEYRNDGNSVDVESEMVSLAKNTEKFKALSEMEKRMIEGVKRVIGTGE